MPLERSQTVRTQRKKELQCGMGGLMRDQWEPVEGFPHSAWWMDDSQDEGKQGRLPFKLNGNG